jgi:hypothetical protein
VTSILLEYRLRIRDAANLTDALTISSVRGDTLPYLEGPPTCDGQEINPLTGEFRSGSYTGYIVDAITSGTIRVFTSQLEDSNFRQQLVGRIAYWEFRTNGGAWAVLGAGYLTLIRLVDGVRWEVTISDATRVDDNALAFSPKHGALALTANASAGATSLTVAALPFAIASGSALVFISGKQATVSAAAAAGATSVSVVGGTVTVAAPGASAGATTVPVTALTAAIPISFVIFFVSGKHAILTANASVGATSLTVEGLESALSAGDSAILSPALSSGDTAPISESFSSYFARWPNRGCLFGGPITGGFLDVPDLGGWIVTAKENVVGYGNDVGSPVGTTGVTFLALVLGYVPPSLKPTTDINAPGMAQVPNTAAETLVTHNYSDAPGFPAQFHSFWPGLVYQIAPASTGFTGAESEFYAPEDASVFPGISSNGKNADIIDTRPKNKRHGLFAATTSLAIGATPLRIRGFTALPTDASPLYWTGHPIDLATALLDEQGRAYDASSVTTVRQAIGADRRLSLRIGSELPGVNAILSGAVYAPFGIGIRVNAAGVLEFFTTRIFNNSPPSTTITAADIQHGTGVQSWFELDEATAIRKVVFEYDNFTLTQETDKTPPDGIAVQHIQIERTNGDPGAVGTGVVSFSVPGMVHAKDAQLSRYPVYTPDGTVQSWVNQLVYEIFDRWGRGVITGELPLLRGGAGDSLKIGDECLNQIPQLPNKNKRIVDDGTVGARAMQIIRLTPTPRGNLIKLIDSGPNAAAVATLPTHTIAVTPGRRALRFAQLKITNATTLNAALCGVEIQMAVTTGAAPASTDYASAGRAEYGKVPTTPITLAGVLAGRAVYARARSTQYGARPSAWTTPVSVSLTALNPPSSLVLTPNGADGSQMLATWTPGANADQSAVDVYVRPSAQPASTAVRVQILDAGSARYNLEGLTPNTSYTVGVQSRDALHNDTSVMVEATNTTANVTVALPIPKRPQIFTGSHHPKTGVLKADGVYGLAVQASTTPSSIEFWEALETGVGAGTYGTAALVDTVASVQGDWTMLQRIAPNDGLRRQLQARHVRDGSTASALTAVQTVTPWGTPTPLAKVAPETSLSRFRCKVKRSAVTVLTTGISANIGWDTEIFDVGNLHDNATNNDRITIPTDGDTGLWLIICNFQFASNATAGRRDVTIVDNTLAVIGRWQDPDNNGGTTNGQVFAVVDSPAAGSWYRVVAFQGSGVNQNFDGGGDPPNFQAIHLW